MVILSFKSRLHKRFSYILGRFLLVLILLLVSIFCSPILPVMVAEANPAIESVEVDVLIQAMGVRNPQVLLEDGLKVGNSTKVTLRNQPEGMMSIQSVKQLPITIAVPQPDGSVKELPDPKDNYKVDLLITLAGKAQIQEKGLFFGKSQLRVGTPTEIEGFNYLSRGSIIDVRIVKSK
ncbi:DUF4330 domain-containing protein [Calothrix sp. UHCC 0171]|uniref:DUF4330 domain-containing protein n=1 Tax=Calothrix sp. UHCC 0171 TaxID=3110245 RepID=UPI002B1FF470|nr:DUF4330 domain-containing protein [Calothrix sp. UHCC 0171]MEA5569717.1 DUF4330 domain-containing protein [Calothrix sp. UHCC 0171]